MENIEKIKLSKEIPIKIFYKNKLFLKKNENNKNRMNKLDKQNDEHSNSINKKGYIYPVAIYKEPTLFTQYKERLILSQKPIEKKPLLNKNYHHIYFNSHSNNLFLNANNNYSNIKSNNNNPDKTFYKKRNNKKEYTKEKNYSMHKMDKNLSYTNFFNCNSNNKIYQNLYLSEIRKRGFNYNKLKIASLQRMAMNNFCKSDIDDNEYNNKQVSYVLESHQRNFFPQMKKFLINKYNNLKNNENLDVEKYIKNNKSKKLMDIKNNPNFKFHIFHDQKGKIKELDKPCKRNLKMTKTKIRDLKIMSKISKINDPEIIEMYKSII